MLSDSSTESDQEQNYDFLKEEYLNLKQKLKSLENQQKMKRSRKKQNYKQISRTSKSLFRLEDHGKIIQQSISTKRVSKEIKSNFSHHSKYKETKKIIEESVVLEVRDPLNKNNTFSINMGANYKKKPKKIPSRALSPGLPNTNRSRYAHLNNPQNRTMMANSQQNQSAIMSSNLSFFNP